MACDMCVYVIVNWQNVHQTAQMSVYRPKYTASLSVHAHVMKAECYSQQIGWVSQF